MDTKHDNEPSADSFDSVPSSSSSGTSRRKARQAASRAHAQPQVPGAPPSALHALPLNQPVDIPPNNRLPTLTNVLRDILRKRLRARAKGEYREDTLRMIANQYAQKFYSIANRSQTEDDLKQLLLKSLLESRNSQFFGTKLADIDHGLAAHRVTLLSLLPNRA